jgi:hypothetical protein
MLPQAVVTDTALFSIIERDGKAYPGGREIRPDQPGEREL